MEVSPVMLRPIERVAVFIDGWDCMHATRDALGVDVDFPGLLAYLCRDAILLRAYYYAGEWSDAAINTYVRLMEGSDAAGRREELERRRLGESEFLRFLDRHGFRVVRRPIRMMRYSQDADPRIKTDLGLELAIDMLTLAERCDKHILVSGDGDLVPLVNAIASRGVRVAVVSTQADEAAERGYRASDDLLNAADEFIDIAEIPEHIAQSTAKPSGPSEAPRVPAVHKDGEKAVSDGGRPVELPAEEAGGGTAEAEPAPAESVEPASAEAAEMVATEPVEPPVTVPPGETAREYAENAAEAPPGGTGPGRAARSVEAGGGRPSQWPLRPPAETDLSGPPIVRDPAVMTREQWLAAKERERAQAAEEGARAEGTGTPGAPTEEAPAEEAGEDRGSSPDVDAEGERDSFSDAYADADGERSADAPAEEEGTPDDAV